MTKTKSAAVAATARIVATGNDYSPLVELIERERTRPRGKGRPPLWISALRDQQPRDIAAAAIYVILESLLNDGGHDSAVELPLVLTVGARLGAALQLVDEKDLQAQVGVQVLGLAVLAGIIEPFTNRDGGTTARVALTNAAHSRIAKLVEGGATHVRRMIRSRAPSGTETKMPRDMRLPRPDAPMRVIEAADKVQSTPWRINRFVLETLRPQVIDNETTRVRRSKGTNWLRWTKARRKAVADMEIVMQAQELRDDQRFYFPVFLDSRGRMYQRGGTLTYTSGSDYARGLLEFADGEVVDEKGMGWLTWHLMQMWGSNLTDGDNLPLFNFGDGRKWVEQQEWLMACARDPVANQKWRDAKHPAQFLAALGAWRDALDGNRCHLPVRLDATCSGLQHVTLLARDTDLAPHVQLWGDYGGLLSDRQSVAWLELPQQDFYTLVARAADATREQAKAVLVPMLYTAGANRCAEALAELRTDGKSSEASESDTALAARIRAAAEEQAPQAFAVLKWFGRVAQSHNDAETAKLVRARRVHWDEVTPQPIRWATPSGFEAVQDYRVATLERCAEIRVDGYRLQLVKRVVSNDIDARQQQISLPANVVHSLDAALLTETVAGADIDLWAVAHDAFGVPPSKVPALTDAYVEGIKAMYSSDRLAEWAEQWRAAGVKVPDPPGDRGPLPPEMLGGLRAIG